MTAGDNAFRPTVSVGLPVYNGENYLRTAIESILNQTFRNLELIITDNASTDATQAICQAYAASDERVRYVRNPKNMGAAYNYNLTVELAKGRYFRWNAHDDYCAPTSLEVCVTALDRHPDVIMAYSRTILIDEHDDVIEYHDDEFHLMDEAPHVRLARSLRGSAWCHPVFGLIRLDELRQTGMIGAYPSSDKVLLSELAIRGKIFETPEHLSYRRLHPEISTRVHLSDEAMAAWFDPTMRTKVTAPRWRRLQEIDRAIRRAKLPPTQAMACRRELLRFYAEPERLKGARRDGLQAGRRLVGRLFRWPQGDQTTQTTR